MKKTITLLALIFVASVNAQTYQKLMAYSVTEFDVVGDEFGVRLANPQQTLSGCSFTANTGIHYAKTDSAYKSNTYKKFYLGSFFQGLMREDTLQKKVYFIPYCDTAETLLYDFSLTQGGTINYTFYSSSWFQNGTYTVDSIRLKHDYKNYYHNHFYLRNHSNSNHQAILEIVEGAGSTAHPLFIYAILMPGAIIHGCTPTSLTNILSCKSDNGKRVFFDSCTYYQASHSSNSCYLTSDSCNYGCFTGGIESYANNNYFTIYPNPASASLNLKMSQYTSESMVAIEIHNVLGEKVYENNYQIGSLAHYQIDVSILPTGIYFVRLGNSTQKVVVQH